jgi:hypothetical protein
MRKRYPGLVYLLIILIPTMLVFWLSDFIRFNVDVIEVIVFTLCCLLAGEVDAEYKSRQFIWSYISDSIRNKVAFTISAVFFLYWLVYPVWFNVYLSFFSMLIWILACMLVGFIMFTLLVTHDLRKKILIKIVPHRSE